MPVQDRVCSLRVDTYAERWALVPRTLKAHSAPSGEDASQDPTHLGVRVRARASWGGGASASPESTANEREKSPAHARSEGESDQQHRARCILLAGGRLLGDVRRPRDMYTCPCDDGLRKLTSSRATVLRAACSGTPSQEGCLEAHGWSANWNQIEESGHLAVGS